MKLLLINEGCLLNKKAITDMIKIRYGWQLYRLPKNCACGQKISVKHALSCQKRRFIIIKHKQVRDTTANLFKIICNDVRIETSLLSLSEESLSKRTDNIQDNIRVDLSASGFWITKQNAFFDITISQSISYTLPRKKP